MMSSMNTRHQQAITKFSDDYTNGIATSVFLAEIQNEGVGKWCTRMIAELTESFPEANPQEIEWDVRRFAEAVTA